MATPALIAERYELGPCIGQGGMGTVSSAVDTMTGKAVAIKQLKRDTKFVDPSAVERFVREGEVLRRLDHPNIVKLLAMIEEGEQHYLVMELVGQGSLESLLQRASPPLPIDRVLSIALDLSDALARAHRLDVIHRDLKPSNVLIAEDGTPRLTDFGVAFILGRERLSASNAVVGTLDYLCPEALTGHDVDARADIWAFGAMLFEMLASRRPFAAGYAAATLHAILTAPPPDLEALRPDCPTALVDLTYRMLEKDRNQRIPSARRVGAELESIIHGRNLPESVSRRKLDARFERQGESPSTKVLYGQGPAGGAPSGSHTALATQDNIYAQLPVRPTPFVGREEELAKLAALLDDHAVRLVTIVGPGGMGKSRLALEAGLLSAEGRGASQATAGRQNPLQRGVVWVELAPLAAPEFIVSAVADSVGLRFHAGSDPRLQLVAFLRARRLLLVLDNFEHVLEGASLVSELLQAAPQLQVLATSRERLGLSLETTLMLSGMGFPASASVERATEYSAVKLFVDAARRVKLDFELGQATLDEAVHICQLLQGMPLAIVLAASWANVLPLRDIAIEIGGGFDFLQAELRDVPERQQSIRAVFDHSWRLLGAGERAVLATLSVFRGGFTRDAAQVIAGASLRTLASLMNKSLITRHPESGRYEIHELLRQYAESRLGEAPADREQALDRHGSYFAAFLGARAAALKRAEPQIVASEIEAELDNVRAAWRQLLASKRFDQVNVALEGLNLFYELNALLVEGEAAFRAAVEALVLAEKEPLSGVSRLLGRTLSVLAGYAGVLGRFADATDLATRALGLLDERNCRWEKAHALVMAGLFSRTASTEERLAMAERGLNLYRTTGDVFETAKALSIVASLSRYWLGDFEKAEATYRECIILQESTGDGIILIPDCLTGLGYLLAQRGNYTEGLQLMQRGIALVQSFGDLFSQCNCLCQLADIERNLGEYARAEGHAQSSLSLSREAAFWEMEVWSHLQLGLIFLEQGRLDEASVHYRSAYTQCVGDSAKQDVASKSPVIAHAQLNMGELAMRRGAYDEAQNYLMGSLSDYERIGTRQGIGFASNSLGHLACHQGEFDGAEVRFRRALEIGQASGVHPLALDAIAGLGRLFAETSEPTRAIELLSLVKSHPATSYGTRRNLVARLLQELAASVPADDYAAIVERGRQLTIEGVPRQ